MQITGRVLDRGQGKVKGEAVVFEVPFSFIGDFDPASGKVSMSGHPLFGCSLKDKILVIPTSRGGTIAPYIAYYAKKNKVSPAAILCNIADTITLECALTADIPIMDNFAEDITKVLLTGDKLEINTDTGLVEVFR